MSANPFRVPEAFDTIVISGEYMPGLVNVGRTKRVQKWDKKEGAGTTGDTLTYRGKRSVDFVIQVTMWEEEQIDEWDDKQPMLEVDGKAHDVVHPILERLKVRSIVIIEVPGLFHEGGGLWTAQIGVNEFKPPPKGNSTVTPKGSANSNGKDGPGAAAKPTTAKSAQEEEIERLLKLAKAP